MAARLQRERPRNVRELACGTGILTHRLRDSLAPTVRFVATDLNPGMLAFAQAKFRANENLVWQEADAGALPFPDGSFDAIVCQFGLMFVPDKELPMYESYRGLNPALRLLFTLRDATQPNPLPHI